MSDSKAPKVLGAVLAGILVLVGCPIRSFADPAADAAALQEQMRLMQQKLDEMKQQLDTVKQQQQQAAAAAAKAQTVPAPAVAKAEPSEPKFDKFLKGFYGTLDASVDYATKGMDGMIAYHIQNGGLGPGLDYTNPKGGPAGNVGWQAQLSTNKSQIGYRYSHKIDDSDVNFIIQVETSLAITASPGLKTSYTQQSNVVNGAIGLGDTFIGVQDHKWGRLIFGTMYSPYKKSTDRLNPFSGMLGDYAVIMGNTGGDNRVEFGTRLDHSIAWQSPKIADMFSANLLVSPGQNRTYDNVVQSAGSPDCNGGNEPGSGNLLLQCDDGGFGDAYSADLEFEFGGFYATVAWELHKDVNRNSDGIGSNNPTYAALMNAAGVTPNGGCNDPTGVLDCATYANLVAEFPGWASVAGGTPPFLNDVANEQAFKVGAQYAFEFGLSVSGIWEHLTRSVPPNLEFQNERQRDGTWVALSQNIGSKDNFSIGWAHAGKTQGDPGGQHNYNPLAEADTADMYTAAWKHHFDKQLYWYADWAVTVNHGNAHYDLGAGGRGLTTDCHDGTNTVITDGSSAGPTTWGGCRPQGFSTGLNFKF
jgi:predicted porin